MGKWQNFYLQKMGTTNGSAYPVCESVATWGVFCKEIPFVLFDKVKAPSKRSWYDEHGDDEFIPDEGLYADAYTMKVSLGCRLLSGKKAYTYGVGVDDVRDNVGNFIEYLRSSGMLKLYSSHTRIGRQYVRLDSVSDNAKWKSDDDEEWLIFDVTFKVNDPITDIELSV